jgi:hypothetical protein
VAGGHLSSHTDRSLDARRPAKPRPAVNTRRWRIKRSLLRQTWRAILTMSVARGRTEVVGQRPK